MKQPNFEKVDVSLIGDKEPLTTEKRPWTKHDDQRAVDKILAVLVKPCKLTPADAEEARLRRQYGLTLSRSTATTPNTTKAAQSFPVKPPFSSYNPSPEPTADKPRITMEESDDSDEEGFLISIEEIMPPEQQPNEPEPPTVQASIISEAEYQQLLADHEALKKRWGGSE